MTGPSACIHCGYWRALSQSHGGMYACHFCLDTHVRRRKGPDGECLECKAEVRRKDWCRDREHSLRAKMNGGTIETNL